MAQMFLVRHAQASFGADNYDNLSELGHQQSILLGDYFTERSIQFDAIVTGDMQRHKQTANGILCGATPNFFNADASWNEFDFESIVTAYLSLHPATKLSAGSSRSQWYKILKNAMLAWSENELSIASESWEQFCQRVNIGANKILSSSHQKVLVVTSGGAMAVFLMAILGVTAQKAIDINMQIKNTSVNELFFNSSGFHLSSFNSVPHLDSIAHMHKVTYS